MSIDGLSRIAPSAAEVRVPRVDSLRGRFHVLPQVVQHRGDAVPVEFPGDGHRLIERLAGDEP